jgi:D-glycero-D-manno-heptose 1,7-bisphosphate phosphatase
MPGIREALKQLASLGLSMIVISNQAAVGKGLLDTAGLEEITSKMYQELAHDGTFLTAAYYCPHRPDENCPCRKPKPALLQAAATDLNIDLTRSVFVGDSATDVEAAHAAGCRPVLFGTGARAVSASSAQNTEVPVARTAQGLFTVVSTGLSRVEPPKLGSRQVTYRS